MARNSHLLCVSINHWCTPLEVRERIVFGAEEGRAFVRELKGAGRFDGVVLLSTCNRTEIYASFGDKLAHDRGALLLEALQRARGFEPRAQPRNYQLARDAEAVRHLFRVAAGLESQILGESQILAQVRGAGAAAREAGSIGRTLHRLWERALRAGKRVRSETALGEGAYSASYAALELARKVFGRLEGRRFLVIGAGEVATLALESLAGIAIGGITVINRTRARAEEMAQRFRGEARDFAELAGAIAAADVVISSTSSPDPIVSYERMRGIRARRGGDRPLLIIDLALPRDFESRCGTLDQVFLKNLDDLHEIVTQNAAQRLVELPRAEAIVDGECDAYLEWLHGLAIEPTILALRERFEAIREEEIERLRGSIDGEALARIDRVTRRLVNRLLHVPSENLRRHPALRDREVYEVLHEVLTRELPHPRAGDPGE